MKLRRIVSHQHQNQQESLSSRLTANDDRGFHEESINVCNDAAGTCVESTNYNRDLDFDGDGSSRSDGKDKDKGMSLQKAKVIKKLHSYRAVHFLYSLLQCLSIRSSSTSVSTTTRSFENRQKCVLMVVIATFILLMVQAYNAHTPSFSPEHWKDLGYNPPNEKVMEILMLDSILNKREVFEEPQFDEAVLRVKLSIIVRLHSDRKAILALLKSLVSQKTKFRYEVIVSDLGCLRGIRRSIDVLFQEAASQIEQKKSANTAYYKDYKYIRLCTSNDSSQTTATKTTPTSLNLNQEFEAADYDSQFVLYLEDDIVLRDVRFVQNMVELLENKQLQHLQDEQFNDMSDRTSRDTKETIVGAGAVGCAILNNKRTALLDAGSTVWSDGSVTAYGLGRTDFYVADELRYTRPVDVVSSSCFLIDIQLLTAVVASLFAATKDQLDHDSDEEESDELESELIVHETSNRVITRNTNNTYNATNNTYITTNNTYITTNNTYITTNNTYNTYTRRSSINNINNNYNNQNINKNNNNIKIPENYFKRQQLPQLQVHRRLQTLRTTGNTKAMDMLQSKHNNNRNVSPESIAQGSTTKTSNDIYGTTAIRPVINGTTTVITTNKNSTRSKSITEWTSSFATSDSLITTELQLRIQYVFHKSIWVQPLSVAYFSGYDRAEVFSQLLSRFMRPPDFTMLFQPITQISRDISKNQDNVGDNLWKDIFMTEHLYPPGLVFDRAEYQEFRGSNVQGRIITPTSPNILYITDQMPTVRVGRGRTLDNVIMIHELGFRTTLFTLLDNALSKLDQTSHTKRLLQQRGIEVIETNGVNMFLEKLLLDRAYYYNVIIINDPFAFEQTMIVLKKEHVNFLLNEVALVYDSSKLFYRQDESVFEYLSKVSVDETPPGLRDYSETYDSKYRQYKHQMKLETSIFSTVDAIVSVCMSEYRMILEHLELFATNDVNNNSSIIKTISDSNYDRSLDTNRVVVIGHSITTNRLTPFPTFEQRVGLLFVGTFGMHRPKHGIMTEDMSATDTYNINNTQGNQMYKDMYYNGDALWYFLRDIYPLVLAKSPNTPLIIAGKNIPQYLHDYVANSLLFDNLVTFAESPPTMSKLYDVAKVTIVPHLYGSGIQYKVVESLAYGVPVVLSPHTSNNYGPSLRQCVCVGATEESFADCITSLYNDNITWSEHHDRGLYFTSNVLNRNQMKKSWKKVIMTGIETKINKLIANNLTYSLLNRPTIDQMGRGSLFCRKMDLDYVMRYDDVRKSIANGTYKNGLEHFYATNTSLGYLYDPEADRSYMDGYGYIALWVKKGNYATGWDHFKKRGEKAGLIYSLRDHNQYLKDYPDVNNTDLASVWLHFQKHGRDEGRAYGCY